MGDMAYRQDVLELRRFSDYIIQNYHSWLTFANDTLGRGVSLEDLVLVTGCDKTSQCACAAWSDSSHSASASFVADTPGFVTGRASIWGRWESSNSVDRNARPQRLAPSGALNLAVSEPDSFKEGITSQDSLVSHLTTSELSAGSDQCVFLRGFRIGERSTWFKRKALISAGDGFTTVHKPVIRRKKDNSRHKHSDKRTPTPRSDASYYDQAEYVPHALYYYTPSAHYLHMQAMEHEKSLSDIMIQHIFEVGCYMYFRVPGCTPLSLSSKLDCEISHCP